MSINRALATAAYLAGALSTASAEIALAQACGFGWVSWCLPVSLDVYVLVALRRRQDVGLAVGVLLVIVSVSHLVSSRFLEMSAWVVIGVSSVAPLILWRVHGLLANHQDEVEQALEIVRPHLEPEPEKVRGLQVDLETPGEPQVSDLEEPGVPPEWVTEELERRAMTLETLVEKLVANAPDLPGRGKVVEMYGVSEHTARRGLEIAREKLAA